MRGLCKEEFLGMKAEAERSEKLLPGVKQPPQSLCAEPGSGFLFFSMLFAPSFQLCQSLMGISFLTLHRELSLLPMPQSVMAGLRWVGRACSQPAHQGSGPEGAWDCPQA